MLFQVEPALESVVDRPDQLPHRLEEALAPASPLALGQGRSNSAPLTARTAANSLDAKPLSAITSRPGRFAGRCGSRSSIAAGASRSSIVVANAHRWGIPVGVQTKNSRSPQKNRECQAQYPYPAQPTMSDRLTAGRERPHCTGVEPTIQGQRDDLEDPMYNTSMVVLARGLLAGLVGWRDQNTVGADAYALTVELHVPAGRLQVGLVKVL